MCLKVKHFVYISLLCVVLECITVQIFVLCLRFYFMLVNVYIITWHNLTSSFFKILILCIMLCFRFFVSGIMYFVLGTFINIARGRKGQGIIPHHQFWAALPVYIMVGYHFIREEQFLLILGTYV